jgi:glucosamine 6-phosphate synthetase-like amidotransferase/phosphosugar isomerase protein
MESSVVFMGHTRLATNGDSLNHQNNSPLIFDTGSCVHNGIVVNDDDLCARFFGGVRQSASDSEILFRLLFKFVKDGYSYSDAVKQTFLHIEGSASIAVFFPQTAHLVLATNTGSLYRYRQEDRGVYVFLSERPMVSDVLRRCHFMERPYRGDLSQIRAGWGCVVERDSLRETGFSIRGGREE